LTNGSVCEGTPVTFDDTVVSGDIGTCGDAENAIGCKEFSSYFFFIKFSHVAYNEDGT